jgi:selenophosphate synthetase-related protein
MLESKFLQIRDDGTHIPALATRIRVEPHSAEMIRAGWRIGDIVVYLMALNTRECQHDPAEWSSGPRTMPNAHHYIEQNWRTIRNHQVIDVEFILCETTKPKEPE